MYVYSCLPRRRCDFRPSSFEDDGPGYPPPTPYDDFKDTLGIILIYPVRSRLNVREMTYGSIRYLMRKAWRLPAVKLIRWEK